MSIFGTRHLYRFLSLLLAASLLAGCGFELRGKADLGFEDMYIQGPKLSFHKELTKLLQVNGVNIVNSAEEADVVLELMSENREQRILSLSGEGVVREYEIFYRINFRLRDPGSETWGPVETIENRTDFTYDDTQLLAKQFEQERLYDTMRADSVRELLRRLVVYKPRQAAPSAQ